MYFYVADILGRRMKIWKIFCKAKFLVVFRITTLLDSQKFQRPTTRTPQLGQGHLCLV